MKMAQQNLSSGGAPPPLAGGGGEGGEDGNCYQISDDDIDECEDLGDDCLLEEVDGGGPNSIIAGRGPYERAWTTDATRALIHIRGPMEGRFTEGRQKRTALWLHCTRQLQKLGYRYSAAKVQKKWHNILITYNKNLSKKYLSGYVHWEFFEEMFKYLQGKKADYETQQQRQPKQEQKQQQLQQQQQQQQQSLDEASKCPQYMSAEDVSLLLPPQLQIDTKSNDDFDDDDSTTMSELKQPKIEFNASDQSAEMPLEITHANGYENVVSNGVGVADTCSEQSSSSVWWKEYFERKLQVDREKVQLQKDMHRDLMQFNKMSLVQQEKIERIKIDAINSLTCTLQKLVEVKNRKT